MILVFAKVAVQFTMPQPKLMHVHCRTWGNVGQMIYCTQWRRHHQPKNMLITKSETEI